MSMQFYRCEKCGNFVAFLTKKSACTPTCCGQEMKELTANTVDAAQEKHVPVISPDGSVIRVKVGATADQIGRASCRERV
mgnify:CR=1 FL=1